MKQVHARSLGDPGYYGKLRNYILPKQILKNDYVFFPLSFQKPKVGRKGNEVIKLSKLLLRPP